MHEFDNLIEEINSTNKVYHPKHYQGENIECLDAIKESLDIYGYKGFLKGNIMKYLWRYESKNGLEDLEKAKYYLDELMDVIKEQGD